jgi:hypothetical protein
MAASTPEIVRHQPNCDVAVVIDNPYVAGVPGQQGVTRRVVRAVTDACHGAPGRVIHTPAALRAIQRALKLWI